MFLAYLLLMAVVIIAFTAVCQLVVCPLLDRRELDAFLADVLSDGTPPEG